MSPVNTKAWKKLENSFTYAANLQMRELFEKDQSRFDTFSIRFENILFDFSKNIITKEILALLVELAEETDLDSAIESMFRGEKINWTEKRAVLHTALRAPADTRISLDNNDIIPVIRKELDKMSDFVEKLHEGQWLGFSGMTITDIVNIGIGGSHLGPEMVCNALRPYSKPGLNMHFVSNVDGNAIHETLKQLNPETTLFIIASKSFTTQETITNAMTAREWFLRKEETNLDDISKHFIALSTNTEAVVEFGIDPANMFEFWDWVGGRYSLWSAIGMSIALYVGMDNFLALLSGANKMDIHFREAPFDRNIPVILGLLGIWYTNFFGADSHAVIPYDHYLAKLPDYIQQLDMESNGKTIDREGNRVNYSTGPVIWGAAGTNAQHSFFQLIHQGSRLIPADFLAPAIPNNYIGNHHQVFLSNFFAQTEALMKGKTQAEAMNELKNKGFDGKELEELLAHKIFEGNKPSNSIMYKKLCPETLGMLISMYEHKVFVQGHIWNINSFDQWGVELGKILARNILPELENENEVTSHDSSTNGLINFYKESK